jgi:hypothetical protein
MTLLQEAQVVVPKGPALRASLERLGAFRAWFLLTKKRMPLFYSEYADAIGAINAMMEFTTLNSGREKNPW